MQWNVRRASWLAGACVALGLAVVLAGSVFAGSRRGIGDVLELVCVDKNARPTAENSVRSQLMVCHDLATFSGDYVTGRIVPCTPDQQQLCEGYVTCDEGEEAWACFGVPVGPRGGGTDDADDDLAG